jgi:hypothetical protein
MHATTTIVVLSYCPILFCPPICTGKFYCPFRFVKIGRFLRRRLSGQALRASVNPSLLDDDFVGVGKFRIMRPAISHHAAGRPFPWETKLDSALHLGGQESNTTPPQTVYLKRNHTKPKFIRNTIFKKKEAHYAPSWSSNHENAYQTFRKQIKSKVNPFVDAKQTASLVMLRFLQRDHEIVRRCDEEVVKDAQYAQFSSKGRA